MKLYRSYIFRIIFLVVTLNGCNGGDEPSGSGGSALKDEVSFNETEGATPTPVPTLSSVTENVEDTNKRFSKLIYPKPFDELNSGEYLCHSPISQDLIILKPYVLRTDYESTQALFATIPFVGPLGSTLDLVKNENGEMIDRLLTCPVALDEENVVGFVYSDPVLLVDNYSSLDAVSGPVKREEQNMYPYLLNMKTKKIKFLTNKSFKSKNPYEIIRGSNSILVVSIDKGIAHVLKLSEDFEKLGEAVLETKGYKLNYNDEFLLTETNSGRGEILKFSDLSKTVFAPKDNHSNEIKANELFLHGEGDASIIFGRFESDDLLPNGDRTHESDLFSCNLSDALSGNCIPRSLSRFKVEGHKLQYLNGFLFDPMGFGKVFTISENQLVDPISISREHMDHPANSGFISYGKKTLIYATQNSNGIKPQGKWRYTEEQGAIDLVNLNLGNYFLSMNILYFRNDPTLFNFKN